MAMRMDGKIGIVTAAASGMGRAGALRFAREGAAVGVADIDEAGVNAVVAEITAAGRRPLAPGRRFRPGAFARGSGARLYAASASGLVGSGFSPVYSMAKFGVVGFVRALAKRLAPDNIRVNAVCPGPIDTPMLRVFVARPDQQTPGAEDKEALIVRRSQQIPMRRTGRPEEIANAALFLLSDEASFVSGAALPVDGAATASFRR